MDPSYAAAYRNLYERHWWWRARERFLLDRLEVEAEVERETELQATAAVAVEADGRAHPARRILDVGCGDALFFDRLSVFGRVEGIEPDADVLSDGPWRSAIHAGTLESFDTDARYQWILMLDVLEHIPEPGAALRRAREFATNGATLFVTVPAFQILWSRHDELNHHHARYDRGTLSELLTESGWRPLEMEYFFHWPAPLKLLIKLAERLVPGRPKVESVPPAPINRLALGLSLLEQRLLGPLPVPFGTSLYARSVRADP